MRKSITYILLLCTLLSLGGCDFLRKAAGRPTSLDIEVMRHQLYVDSLARKAVADSVRKAEELRLQAIADSTVYMDSLAAVKCNVKTIADNKGITEGPLEARYWLVTGAFKSPANASNRLAQLQKAGYDARTVTFGTGLTAVIAAPEDDLKGIWAELNAFKATKLFGVDTWILDAAPVAVTE